MTREIRNGIAVDKRRAPTASPSSPGCGTSPAAARPRPARARRRSPARSIYSCTTTACSRTEARKSAKRAAASSDDRHRHRLQRSLLLRAQRRHRSDRMRAGAGERIADLRRHHPEHSQPAAARLAHRLRRRQHAQRDPLLLRCPLASRHDRGHRSEAGFTIIEVLVAALILALASAATLRRARRGDPQRGAGEVDPGGARPRPAGDGEAAQPQLRRTGARPRPRTLRQPAQPE